MCQTISVHVFKPHPCHTFKLHVPQGMSREIRNIGSDDEFILVPGSMRKVRFFS